MAGVVENVATHVAESLADKAMQELKYLCCYKSYVDDFEGQKKHLKARRETIQKDIEEAHDRNENQIESEVKLWREEADRLIEQDTKGKEKWFGLVTNCFWQYNQGKYLEDKKQRIQKLVEQSNNFTRVARSTGLPGIEFYSFENFMQLKERKLQFGKLMEALKNDKKFVIGLYGLGGTGKTSMAKEVGKEVAESKVFDKVIFTVVSKDANLKKIRDNISKHLNLPLKEGTDESEHTQELWKRIAEGGEKVLLILDDVWEKLSLQDIGIPLGRHGKSCCSMLLTTRDRKVCRDMGCHETIKLEVLNDQDAVDLFLSYAGQSIDDCSIDFKDVALDIVKECGRLPVAIVAVARALNSRPLIEWKQGLERLQNPKSIHDVNEYLKEAYNSLRLSYDYLKNKEAKKLFLLCSLFPDDYEIPIELLTRIAICLGLCGEANRYSTTRIHFTPIKNALIDSCLLLLKAENEAVKMHDLVREVALWIGNKLVQVVMDSSTTLMENIQYSFWNINDFPSHFDGRKLEVLLLWISNNADSTTVKVPGGIFEGMENLKFLALMNWSNITIPGTSLFQSHSSLINARTLAIKGFELGDISILANLKSLECLELSKCSMIELPKEIRELEKLRLLEMEQCVIERNNPFEVIGSCLQLEELYFASNHLDKDACESLAQITTFPKLERYQIKGCSFFSYDKVDFSISRYFDSRYLRVNFFDEIFKSLVARAEVLELGGDYYNRGWTNVVPDILPVKDDSMEEHLTRLCLESMNGIKCLIRTECLRSGVAIFSKLVELELSHSAMKVNYVVNRAHGLFTPPLYPHTVLRKLEISKLVGLKSLFTLSVASSLKLLEILHVSFCNTLEHIVTDKEDDHDHMNVNSIFPNLRELNVYSCSKLKYLFPAFYSKDFKDLESVYITYHVELTHVFGKCHADQNHNVHVELNLPSLKRLYLCGIPNLVSICAQNYSMKALYLEDIILEICPQLPLETLIDLLVARHKRQEDLPRIKALPPLEEKRKQLYNLQEFPEFKEPKSYMSFQNLSKLKIDGCKQLKFIFSASTSRRLQNLRKLEVKACEELVSIIEDQENNKSPMAQHQVLFRELRTIQVRNCKSMEYLFSISSGKLPRLLHVYIEDTPQLGEVFRWKHGEGQKLVMEDVFPKLYMMRLVNLPTLHTICQGIDFHTVKLRRVRECPAISLTSANDSSEELKKLLQSYERNSVHEDEDARYVTMICREWDFEIRREAVKFLKASTEQKQNSILPNLSEIEEEGSQQDIENDSTMPQQNNGSPNFEISEDVSREIAGEDSTTNSNLLNLTKSIKTSANEIVEEKLSTTPSSDIDMNLKVTFGEGHSSEKYGKASSSKEKIMNKPESSTAKQVKFDGGNHQQFAEDDLMTLFQIMEEGAEMEVHMPHVSKIAAVHDDNELIKALADLEGSLKMSLNEIASSKESVFRLENALNILSSYCSEHGAPSHGLQTTIHTLQQEIQNVLSSSKQSYATIDTFNKLEHKEKLFTEEGSKRKEAAVALLSEIYNKESSLAEASLKEAELKEQISKLQAELDRKEKQVQEYEMELISLKEQKKKSVYDTMGFIKEFEAVKKERSHMVEENMNAKEHLQNMNVKWSSCLSNLKKTTLLLAVHLQQKL